MLHRRHLLLGLAAGTLTPVLPQAARAEPERIVLWPTGAPEGGGPAGPESRSPTGAVRNIGVPSLTVHEPEEPNGAAALVVAGGGYKLIQMGTEAEPAARWLAAQGVTAFVLRYRLPDEGWAAGPRAPLQDIQRSLRLIREGAAVRGLDARRLGVLGFSAGGHLAGLAATRSAWRSYAPVDPADERSAHADFAALVYPVVTLLPPYERTATRIQMVGRHPSPAASADWSVETHVRSACPPLFLAQAADDRIADPANTLILEAAARQAKVPVERHLFPEGGHGFGLGRPGTPAAAWPAMCRSWLSGLRML